MSAKRKRRDEVQMKSTAMRATADRLRVTAAGDVRIGPVAAIPAVLSELGHVPRRAFMRAGVPMRAFNDPDSRISFDALGHLFAESANLAGRDDIGLLVGKRFRMRDLGTLGELMCNVPTVGEALRALMLHLHLYDRGAVPVLLKLEPSTLLLGYSIYRHDVPGMANVYDVAVAIGFRILADLCGPGWEPLRVQFSHSRPRSLTTYHRLFGTNVQFDAEVSGIAFSASWAEQPVAGADPLLCRQVAAAIARDHAMRGATFADEVCAVLHQMILGGSSSAAKVASLFDIHERTLRKRLAAEGANFQVLVSQTRFELAKQLLENTRLPLGEISAALGFSNPAVFSRAFRTWANITPRQWRAQSGRDR